MRSLFAFLVLAFAGMPVFAVAAPPSENCEKARSSADVMRCLSQHYERAQEDLNTAFETLSLKKTGEDLANVKDIQARWLDYRDRECAMETSHLQTESLKRLESLRCLSRLTQERIEALQVVLQNNSEEPSVIGEAGAAQPRWMNALAEDHPDVFWRYGERIEGDFDCDDSPEYAMTGLRVDEKTGAVQAVVSISENPATGRPKSDVLPVLPQSSAEEETSELQGCGFLFKATFKAGPPVQKREESEGEADEAPVPAECEHVLVLSAPDCPEQVIRWTGDSYVRAE